MIEERRSSLRIPTPWGAIEVRGMTAIMGAILVGNVLLVVLFFQQTQSMLSIASALQKLGVAQREFACLVAQKEVDRREWWDSGRCRKIAEGN